MDKKNVITDIFTKLFFCGSDIPATKLFCSFLWLWTKEDAMGIKTCLIAKQDNKVSIINN